MEMSRCMVMGWAFSHLMETGGALCGRFCMYQGELRRSTDDCSCFFVSFLVFLLWLSTQ